MCLVFFFNLSYPLACNFIMIHVCVFLVSDISITRIEEMKMMHVKNAHSSVSSDGSTGGCSRPLRHARFEPSTVRPNETRALKSWNWDPIFDDFLLQKRPWNYFSFPYVSKRWECVNNISNAIWNDDDAFQWDQNAIENNFKIAADHLECILKRYQRI